MPTLRLKMIIVFYSNDYNKAMTHLVIVLIKHFHLRVYTFISSFVALASLLVFIIILLKFRTERKNMCRD